MKILVSGATATLRKHAGSRHLGHLLVPGAGHSIDELIKTGWPWAADNSAFHGFDAAAFCRMLGRIAGKAGCVFVACPDVVGDASATARQFYRWQPIIKSMGLPVALVGQDGQGCVGVEWGMIDAFFIGGSTKWKLGAEAAKFAREAKRRGIHVHMGRVNTRQRLRYACELGCDSVDGSGFSRWPDTRIPLGLAWIKECERQPMLGLAA